MVSVYFPHWEHIAIIFLLLFGERYVHADEEREHLFAFASSKINIALFFKERERESPCGVDDERLTYFHVQDPLVLLLSSW